MNLIRGTIGGTEAMPTFTSVEGWTVPLAARNLSAAQGEPVWLGIRPEDVRLVEAGSAADLCGKVAIVERLGAETYLSVVKGAETLLVRVQGDLALRPGDAVRLVLERAGFHLFDHAEQVF